MVLIAIFTFIINSSNSKLNYFEGLRGLLALMVVINHFILLFCPVYYIGSFDLKDFTSDPSSFRILLANTPLNIFMNGRFAVCAFFGISGYVLTLLYRNKNDFRILQRNMIKRYVRLVIPVLAVCLLIYLLFITRAFAATNYPTSDATLSFGHSLFKTNLSFLAMLKMALLDVPVSASNSYLPILWTISVEFTGVLTLFAFLMLTHNLNKKWVYATVVITGCLFISKYYVPLLFAGSLVCIYEYKIKMLFKNKLYKLFLLLGFLYFSGVPNIADEAKVHTIYSFTTRLDINVYPYFHNLATVLLLLVVVSSESLKKLLSFKFLPALGKLSFSIYLLHLPVLYCFGTYLMHKLGTKVPLPVLFLICLSAIILTSAAFYFFVDRPAIRISGKFGKLIVKEPSIKPSATQSQ